MGLILWGIREVAADGKAFVGYGGARERMGREIRPWIVRIDIKS